jgi:hypothetical protein
MWKADVTCPSQPLHHIVVTTRVQCRREVKSLCKELIAEGFSAWLQSRTGRNRTDPCDASVFQIQLARMIMEPGPVSYKSIQATNCF